MNKIKYNLDQAFFISNNGLNNVAILNGWIRGAAPYAVGNLNAPETSCLRTVSVHRPDVAEIYGARIEEGKAGSGFLGIAYGALSEELKFYAARGEKITPVCDLRCKNMNGFAECLDNLLSVGFQWQQLLGIYGKFGQLCEQGLTDRARSLVPTEELFGEPAQNPANSIIIPLYDSSVALEEQILSFSMDKNQDDKTEIIYICAQPANKSRIMAHIGECYGIFRTPMRLVVPDCALFPSQAWNLGAQCATGKRLAFLPENAVAQLPEWLWLVSDAYSGKIVLSGQPNFQLCGLPACIASAVAESIFASCPAGPHIAARYFSYNNVLAVEKEVFLKMGGFSAKFVGTLAPFSEFVQRCEALSIPVICDNSLGIAFQVFPTSVNDVSQLARHAVWDIAQILDQCPQGKATRLARQEGQRP